LSQFMWAVKFFFGTVLLGILAPSEDVGRFGAALRIVIALHTFVALYFYNLLPLISRASRDPVSVLRSLVGGSIRASSWVALLLGVMGMIAAAPLVQIIYGADYEESVVVLQLLLWMLGATLLSSHYRCILIGRNHQKLELLSTSIGAGLNVLLFALLYPVFGLAGAASAMLVSELITGGLAYYFVSRRIAAMDSWRHVRQPIMVGVVIIIATYLIAPNTLWLRAVVALALFIVGVSILDWKMFIDLRASLKTGVAEESALTR
jgi:O-antigen/teichoic acid export membrane protein